MAKLFSLLLSQAVGSQGLQLSDCETHALWITLPLPKGLVQAWINEQLEDEDKGKITLDDVPGYTDTHPVQIEFDNFGPCKSFKSPIPYPDFGEIATQVPFVRWQGESSPTGFHFQPWAVVNNAFGDMAMLMLGARHIIESGGDMKYPDVPANWSHSSNAEGGGALSVRNAHVEKLQDSSSLADEDAAWRQMLPSKHTRAVSYAMSITGKRIFACNNIQWDIHEAAKVVSGELTITQGDNHKGSYFPRSLSGDISTLTEQFPGLEVYAVHATMTANCHCPQDVVV